MAWTHPFGLQGPDFAGSFLGSPDGAPAWGLLALELQRTGSEDELTSQSEWLLWSPAGGGL